MQSNQSLQDQFLETLRDAGTPVAIFLVNGVKLQGTVETFDEFVVILKNAVSQMIYKHAISSVVPMRDPRAPAYGDDEAMLDAPHHEVAARPGRGWRSRGGNW